MHGQVMPDLEVTLLIIAGISALLGGVFTRAKPGLIVLLVAFSYFVVAFVLFDKTQSLWFVTLMMGFCLAGVVAMIGAFSGRALAKLMPRRD